MLASPFGNHRPLPNRLLWGRFGKASIDPDLSTGSHITLSSYQAAHGWTHFQIPFKRWAYARLRRPGRTLLISFDDSI